MPALHASIDPHGLLEYSVVYTDRSLNHMSARFVGVMQSVLALLKQTYSAHASALVPGGGTYGMEAVARQLAQDARVLIVRNGWFSYRWSQILEAGRITAPEQIVVCQAQQTADAAQAPWQPAPLEELVAQIAQHQPAVVFAPHVETASGMVLPDSYIRAVADAVHAQGGLLVLDCIASGCAWVDMPALGVDVLISAPQKGWSASPCAAMVCLSAAAYARVQATSSSSFAMDLKKWLSIADGYVAGNAAYHATMPTDAIVTLERAMQETLSLGRDAVAQAQWELGRQVRALLAQYGYASVAADGFAAPGVVVSYTSDAQMQNGTKFKALGLQTAAGVPLMCGERADYSTFRLGLFGLDKLRHIPRTVATLEDALKRIAG